MPSNVEVLREIHRRMSAGGDPTKAVRWPDADGALSAAIAALERQSYVPQDIAMECLRALSPLDVKGEPNTLWALVHKAMRIIGEQRADLASAQKRIEELEEAARWTIVRALRIPEAHTTNDFRLALKALAGVLE